MNSNNLPQRAYIHLEPENQRWIDARTAWILREFGIGHVLSCAIALPNSALLAEYRGGTDAEVLQYFGRVAEAVGLDSHRIDFSLHSELKLADGLTALGTYQAVDGRFVVSIDESQLNEPPVMLAILVHELCHVHLMGNGRISGAEPDNEPLTDLLGVFMGYGILLANSVVFDESLRMGHFYENTIGRRGYLTMPMYGYALALLARLRGEDGSEWKQHMRPDVRDAFVKSLRFFARHGMPDLSTVPSDFAAPRIELQREDDVVVEPNRRAPFYPEDYEPEQPRDELDFETSADSQDDDAVATCIYCCAPVDSDEEQPICRACQDSIDEGDRELDEMRAADEKNDHLQHLLFTWGAVFVGGVFGVALILWICGF